MMAVSPASAPAAPALSGARGDVASHKGGFAGALSAQHEGASAAGDAHTRSLQPAPASALPATATAGTESDPEPAQDAEASIAFDGATALASLQARAEPQTAPTQPAGAALLVAGRVRASQKIESTAPTASCRLMMMRYGCP